jgi:hypothetical protein
MCCRRQWSTWATWRTVSLHGAYPQRSGGVRVVADPVAIWPASCSKLVVHAGIAVTATRIRRALTNIVRTTGCAPSTTDVEQRPLPCFVSFRIRQSPTLYLGPLPMLPGTVVNMGGRSVFTGHIHPKQDSIWIHHLCGLTVLWYCPSLWPWPHYGTNSIALPKCVWVRARARLCSVDARPWHPRPASEQAASGAARRRTSGAEPPFQVPEPSGDLSRDPGRLKMGPAMANGHRAT